MTQAAEESPALLANEAIADLPGTTPDDAYGTTYEIFVGSFADSDGDGIGDLKGIEEHLDYINDGDDATAEDLGCNAIWLTPIFSSPTYHKYDAADYETIDPDFGTIQDFDSLLAACHERGIRLYLDLAVNHTSTEHPWFRKAADYLKSLDNGQTPDPDDFPYTQYYNFSCEPQDGYAPLEGTSHYYEARFWEGMPDLNLDSGAVRKEIASVTKFWLDRGIDGFRLDALTSYYTDSQSRSIDFLKWLTETVKSQKSGAYLVGECWADELTIADYYDSGIDSLFDFPAAGAEGSIASAVRSGNGAKAWAEQMEAEEEDYASRNPSFINAPFYTNHDMDRSAGYYSYDDGTKTKLAEGMNLLMTGNAYLYYGEEIGMKGSGKDENKRAPMLWSEEISGGNPDETGGTESGGDASKQVLLYDPSTVTAGPADMDEIVMKYGSAAEQTQDPSSILSYCREAIRIRSSFPVIARGKTKVIESLSSGSVAVFERTDVDGDEPVLIAVNTGDDEAAVDLADGEEAAQYTVLAAALNARTAAAPASSSAGRRGRRSTQTGTSSEAPALSSSLEGTLLRVPAYGIAVLTK